MADERTETIMIRVTADEKKAFKLACVKLGQSMSTVLRRCIRNAIWYAREDPAWEQWVSGERIYYSPYSKPDDALPAPRE